VVQTGGRTAQQEQLLFAVEVARSLYPKHSQCSADVRDREASAPDNNLPAPQVIHASLIGGGIAQRQFERQAASHLTVNKGLAEHGIIAIDDQLALEEGHQLLGRQAAAQLQLSQKMDESRKQEVEYAVAKAGPVIPARPGD
jgi:hypothetical protein